MKKKTPKKLHKRAASPKRKQGWSHLFIFRFTTLSVLAVAIIAITAGFLFNFLPQTNVLGAKIAMFTDGGDGGGSSSDTPKTCEPRLYGNSVCRNGHYYVHYRASDCSVSWSDTGKTCPTPAPTPKVTIRWAYVYCSGAQPHLRFSWGTNYTSKTNFYMGLMNNTNNKKPLPLYRFKITDKPDNTTVPYYYSADIPLNPSKFNTKIAIGNPLLVVVTDGLSNVGTKTAKYDSGLTYPKCPADTE